MKNYYQNFSSLIFFSVNLLNLVIFEICFQENLFEPDLLVLIIIITHVVVERSFMKIIYLHL
jgi:hypothetical protein